MRRKLEQRLTLRIATALIASVVSFTIVAQNPTPRPKLVVGIMIDGLREDYLDLLKGYFGENGFKLLMQNGVMLDNVDFGTALDPAAATAVIFSGAAPTANGIPAAYVYDPEKHRQYSIVLDASKIGNYTDETYSPAAMRVSTLSDEIRIDGAGFGSVHSIAPTAPQAIIMAGHAGNSAFWINDVTGKWATTTYYKDVPSTMQSRNYSKPLSTRLDTITWRPSLTPDKYPDLPAYKKYYPFRYLFQRNDLNRYKNYKTSAPVNTEVTDIAIDYIKSLNLGNHDAMDMLNLSYTVAPFTGAKDSDNRIETMDSYLRLDYDISRLLQLINTNIGLKNTLVFVAGTPAAASSKRDDEKWGIPYGEFSTRRAMSLLNVFLMAKYGNGEWVSGYHNNQVFLNQKLIKDHDIDLRDIRTEVADFMIRMSGVSRAWTIDDITAQRAGNNAEALNRNTQVDYAGDVFVEVTPGWEVVDIDLDTQKENRSTVRTGIITAPAFILSPSIKPTRIMGTVDARSIAPTVARLLRIRSPNATELPPLTLEKIN